MNFPVSLFVQFEWCHKTVYGLKHYRPLPVGLYSVEGTGNPWCGVRAPKIKLYLLSRKHINMAFLPKPFFPIDLQF